MVPCSVWRPGLCWGHPVELQVGEVRRVRSSHDTASFWGGPLSTVTAVVLAVCASHALGS